MKKKRKDEDLVTWERGKLTHTQVRAKLEEFQKLAYKTEPFCYPETWKLIAEKLQKDLNARVTDYKSQKDSIYTNMVDKYEKRLKEKNEKLDKNYSIFHSKDEEISKFRKKLDTLKGIKTYFINYGDIEKYNINKVKADNFYISDDYTIFELEGKDIFKIKTSLINMINME